MSNSIAVFGAGPGVGQAVARRFAREGYAVTLVGRRQEPLDLLAKELTTAGATAHVITAYLSHTEGHAPAGRADSHEGRGPRRLLLCTHPRDRVRFRSQPDPAARPELHAADLLRDR